MIYELNGTYVLERLDVDEVFADNKTDDVNRIEDSMYQLISVVVEREAMGFAEYDPEPRVILTFETYGHMFSVPHTAVSIRQIHGDKVRIIKDGRIIEL